MKPMIIGIIGCGNISNIYMKNAARFPVLKLKSCADINQAAADAKAAEYNIQSTSVDAMLADPEIEMIINLTIPAVHAKINNQILNAGKHAYAEKPIATTLEDARGTLALAKKKKLRVGCAPDTFLGAGLQTCRKIIDDGWIGKPLAGTAFMLGGGPEGWHPNPAFFYEKGAGPMLDVGVYYITALVHLLGPAKAVTAVTGRGFPYRLATCKEHFNEKLKIEVPTHYAGVIEFKSGALITTTVSFDIKKHTHSPIEIYGESGTLGVPDPNTFGNDVKLFRPGNTEWKTMSYVSAYSENSRILGAADMATAIRTNRPHRASGDLAFHVLDIMYAFERASDAGKRVELDSRCDQPAPFPMDLVTGLLDEGKK
ncbi:MAG: Gfo/Idh/MocA family oxidoreductase [Planctomycetota bacterium]